MEWNGQKDGMEWNRNFGMEYGRCQNGMECKISRMEWKTIVDFAHGIYRKLCTGSDN